jgi:hypothetical protein
MAYAYPEARARDGLHVDDVRQVLHIGRDVVVLLRCSGLAGALVGNSLHVLQAASQHLVCPLLDCPGGLRVCRPAVGRVVLEAPVLWRVVGGSDDNAVRHPRLSSPVVRENGVGDDRRGGIAKAPLIHDVDPVGGEDL